jgi:hypothetical protein
MPFSTETSQLALLSLDGSPLYLPRLFLRSASIWFFCFSVLDRSIMHRSSNEGRAAIERFFIFEELLLPLTPLFPSFCDFTIPFALVAPGPCAVCRAFTATLEPFVPGPIAFRRLSGEWWLVAASIISLIRPDRSVIVRMLFV